MNVFMARVQSEEARALTSGSPGEVCLERERREQIRYGVQALVNFEWTDEGVHRRGQGITRDISPKGMFIYSDTKPPAKADVYVDISFQGPGFRVGNLQMSARGLVIRVELGTGPGSFGGFAILNRSYDLGNGVNSVVD